MKMHLSEKKFQMSNISCLLILLLQNKLSSHTQAKNRPSASPRKSGGGNFSRLEVFIFADL